MHNEEQIFDFMAAAEETAKQLDEMAKRLPGELKAVLAGEWRQSPWLTEFPKATDKAMEVMKQTEAATRFLARTVKIAGLIVCLASVIVPLLTWGITHWNLSDSRKEQSRLEQKNTELEAAIKTAIQTERAIIGEIVSRKSEIEKLSGMVKAMQNVTGGIEVVDNGNGSWEIVLPANTAILKRAWRNLDGRVVVPYIASED